MTLNEIKQKTNEALAEEFEIDISKMVDDARIKEDLELDSLDIVDMVIVLEKTFNFKLKDKEKLTKIVTLSDIHTFIAQIQEEELKK